MYHTTLPEWPFKSLTSNLKCAFNVMALTFSIFHVLLYSVKLFIKITEYSRLLFTYFSYFIGKEVYGIIMSTCLLSLLITSKDFHETWYEHHATTGHPIFVYKPGSC